MSPGLLQRPQGLAVSPVPSQSSSWGFLVLQELTPTRPNSHARSRGVFPELSMMQGLDWCCRSISDCGEATPQLGEGRDGSRAPPPPPLAPPYHVVVAVLRCQVQGDLALVRWDVHGGTRFQHHFHGLLLALPSRVVQGPHACRRARHQRPRDAATPRHTDTLGQSLQRGGGRGQDTGTHLCCP